MVFCSYKSSSLTYMEGQWGLYSIVKHHGHIWGWVIFFFPCVDGFKTNLLLNFLLKPLCWNFFSFFIKIMWTWGFFLWSIFILMFSFNCHLKFSNSHLESTRMLWFFVHGTSSRLFHVTHWINMQTSACNLPFLLENLWESLVLALKCEI